MSRVVFRLPDLGEGTVSAEIVAWKVQLGDQVVEGQPIAEMSTDKAVVDIPAPFSGQVVALGGAPGDTVAVGAELIAFETAAATTATSAPPVPVAPVPVAPVGAASVSASPSTRRRAREAGVDLASLTGSGPGGRIESHDVDRARAAPPAGRDGTETIKVLGVRRVIAQRMAAAKRNIPHFSYVEEVDVTELDQLREHLNANGVADRPKLTLLPFVIAALVRVLARFPQCNAHYDEATESIVRYRAVHVGIATQTPDGLKVPVLRHAEGRGLWDLAREIRSVADAARNNRTPRDQLTGSTITVTSLGKLGGIASTPIINAPEVAIIGINRMVERPAVHGGAIVVRKLMNLSSSFDHRFVDGFDAAAMIQDLRLHLQHPATVFLPE